MVGHLRGIRRLRMFTVFRYKGPLYDLRASRTISEMITPTADSTRTLLAQTMQLCEHVRQGLLHQAPAAFKQTSCLTSAARNPMQHLTWFAW